MDSTVRTQYPVVWKSDIYNSSSTYIEAEQSIDVLTEVYIIG